MFRMLAVATVAILIPAAVLTPTLTAPGTSRPPVETKRNKVLGTLSVEGFHIALASGMKHLRPALLAFPSQELLLRTVRR